MRTIILIQDGLTLNYGILERRRDLKLNTFKIVKNVFNRDIMENIREYTDSLILRSGDGIKTFSSQSEIDKFLSTLDDYKIYNSKMIHKKINF